MSGPNSYTRSKPMKTTVCKQGGAVTPDMNHHNPYTEWSTDVFPKWCEERKWRKDRLFCTTSISSSSPDTSETDVGAKEIEQRLKNATDPELIKRRKEITDSFVAKSTRNQCKTTEELTQKLKDLGGSK